jgi:RecJ-like exonuclease
MKRCQWCDNTFETKISYKIYCSAECREAATKDKIAQKYAQKRRVKMMSKVRHCKSCNVKLSAYNDEPVCNACELDTKDVNKTLKEIRDISNGKLKEN